uniref:Uncharacterized protein n=1 Tax=Oryza punctata TaxID=4537 RepID=A0A0E0K2M9_ORYPU
MVSATGDLFLCGVAGDGHRGEAARRWVRHEHDLQHRHILSGERIEGDLLAARYMDFVASSLERVPDYNNTNPIIRWKEPRSLTS